MNLKFLYFSALAVAICGCASHHERALSTLAAKRAAANAGAASDTTSIASGQGGNTRRTLTIAGRHGLVPVADRPLNQAETQELESIFAAVSAAVASLGPGPD